MRIEHASIVDQQVDGRLAKRLGKGDDGSGIGHIERVDGQAIRMAGREVGQCHGAFGRTAGGMDTPGPVGEETAHELQSDAAIGAGDDECGGGRGGHGQDSGWRRCARGRDDDRLGKRGYKVAQAGVGPNGRRRRPSRRIAAMSSERIAPFLGTWILDLDESEFDQSELPQAATCRIEEEFGLVSIRMSILSASGEEIGGEITGVPGAPGARLSESGLADRLLLYFEDEYTLTSEAKRGDLTLMTARRRLSDDGQSLEVEQSVVVPGQGPVINTGIYRRAQ